MTSAARRFANQQNSLESTGPTTDAGKAASSMNAVRHGLTSKQIVLKDEDPAEYDALREGTLLSHPPGNETERVLVEEVSACAWRLLRARRFETAVLDKLVGDTADSADAFATIFIEKPAEIGRLTRYINAIERSYYRSLNKLMSLQADRQRAERQQTVEMAWLAARTRPRTVDGSVSQKEPLAYQSPDLPVGRISAKPGPHLAAVPLTAN